LIVRTIVVAAHEARNLNACRAPRQERIFGIRNLQISWDVYHKKSKTLFFYEFSLFHARE